MDAERWAQIKPIFYSAALAGDTAKSCRAYQEFFALWKDADPDLPILLKRRRIIRS